SRTFAELSAADGWKPSITGDRDPEQLKGQRVTASYFRALGVSPMVGGDFTDGDDQPGGPNVAILSDGLVQRRFGGDLSIVGKRVSLDGDEYLVLGVMPRGFANVPAPAAEIWAPLQD